MIGIPHRYLTERHPGVGGVIKRYIEDFQVDEVPLYRPSDCGEHTFFEIEKYDLSTLQAVERIARALEVPRKEIGYAGLKDRKGITRQLLSVRRVPPERVRALRLSQIEVRWVRLHANKLRIGHLRGNRFRIRVRNIATGSHSLVDKIIGMVGQRGLPNYYGPQRFGSKGDAFIIGACLLGHKHEEAIRCLLGYPSRLENNPLVILARHRFMAGDLHGALELFPKHYHMERRLLHYLLQAHDNYRGAVRQINEDVRKIFYSAYQSYLFNKILDQRLDLTAGQLGRLYEGDLAYIHRNGAVFRVVGSDVEQHRSDRFEISPSGPLFGKMMIWPLGLEKKIETDMLNSEGIRPTLFHQLMPTLRMKGGRRPFRVAVHELRWETNGQDLYLEFFLPKGAYATTFLREILKNDEPAPSFYGLHDREEAAPDALIASAADEIEVQDEMKLEYLSE